MKKVRDDETILRLTNTTGPSFLARYKIQNLKNQTQSDVIIYNK